MTFWWEGKRGNTAPENHFPGMAVVRVKLHQCQMNRDDEKKGKRDEAENEVKKTAARRRCRVAASQQ